MVMPEPQWHPGRSSWRHGHESESVATAAAGACAAATDRRGDHWRVSRRAVTQNLKTEAPKAAHRDIQVIMMPVRAAQSRWGPAGPGPGEHHIRVRVSGSA